jgi:hypothetical protein
MKDFSIILVGHVNTWDMKPIYSYLYTFSYNKEHPADITPPYKTRLQFKSWLFLKGLALSFDFIFILFFWFSFRFFVVNRSKESRTGWFVLNAILSVFNFVDTRMTERHTFPKRGCCWWWLTHRHIINNSTT